MKAFSTVITVTLILVISIAFAGIIYTWVGPLTQKKQDTIKVERLLKSFDPSNPDSLPRKIEYVAKTGSEASFRIDYEGIWTLYPYDYIGAENNSIQFSTFSKVSNIAVDAGWISYTPGGTCPYPKDGKIGESASVVCIKADPQADGFSLTYRVAFRELEETPERIHRIELKGKSSGISTSSEKIIYLKFDGREVIDNKIITRILVLF
jgi:hypothetical protein